MISFLMWFTYLFVIIKFFQKNQRLTYTESRLLTDFYINVHQVEIGEQGDHSHIPHSSNRLYVHQINSKYYSLN